MHKLASLLVLLGMCVLPALAANESFKGVSLIDSNCSKKAAADPDSHTRQCSLKCQASGYGILTSDQKFIVKVRLHRGHAMMRGWLLARVGSSGKKAFPFHGRAMRPRGARSI
jgi:hypothetical protein